MDFELFLSSPRWSILEIIAREPSSPLEISEKLDTSVSYVSQQLKLLEAANLVIKNKTGKAERGKPRSVFSLASEFLHLSALIKGSPGRKAIYLTDYHKIILKIWMLENPELHYPIGKLYWQLEEDFDDVDGIAVDQRRNKVFVVSDSKKIKGIVEAYGKTEKEFDFKVISLDEAGKVSGDLFVIHDSKSLFSNKEEVKGGNE